MGYVAPTILSVRLKLIEFTNLKHCRPICLAIITALEKRFFYLFDLSCPESKDFIIASMSHPKFKLSWVPLRYKNSCKDLFLAECCKAAISVTNSIDSTTDGEEEHSDNSDDFFKNVCTPNNLNSSSDPESRNLNNANVQALSFLNKKKKRTQYIK